ncbi:hypothetical protein DYB28_003906 [Aphanomyces astaci]|uniref:Uncharacterized protein n=1 Tax=Aphanomyces astaci TaxID=112090 RepID=A0A9X8H8I6_APHAT|nr:hypothetical protein DYB28_003906 [Aphanomyces astaci]
MILDAESRVGRMLDKLMRWLEQDHQEWVVHQGGKRIVQVMAKSMKPESLKTAVQKKLQLQRNKVLKSDVFRYANWVRKFAAGHGREDAAKNNGRVGGKAEAIVHRTVEPPAKKGCLKCGDMSRRVLVNQPQRQKTERGVLLENIVRVDDVLLDSVGTVLYSVPHLAYPYGSDAKPVVMMRCVKFDCVTLDTTCRPFVLRGLKAWVDDASTATELIVSRPVNELLGFSVEDLLVGARKKKEEWDVSSVPTNELSGIANVKRLMAEKLNPPEVDPDDGMDCATPEVYPKTSVDDEAERRRTKQGAV